MACRLLASIKGSSMTDVAGLWRYMNSRCCTTCRRSTAVDADMRNRHWTGFAGQAAPTHASGQPAPAATLCGDEPCHSGNHSAF